MDQIIELLNTFQGLFIGILLSNVFLLIIVALFGYIIIDFHFKDYNIKKDIKYDLDDFKLLEDFKEFQKFKNKGK